jgi:hypothetical protein
MTIPESVRRLERDLRGIFGSRLSSLVVYGAQAHAHAHTLAVVDGLSRDDLRACAARVDAWHDDGLATPLFLGAHEFASSLDAFPLEFGAIVASHVVVSGANPFDGLTVDAGDLRRAVEVQARGHLLHLREGFVETRGRSDALAVLIVSSAPALATLLLSVARLDGRAGNDAAAAARHVERMLGLTSRVLAEVAALANVKEISSAEADRLFAPYLDAVDALVARVDTFTK